jgi:hypothetical protein
MVRARTSIASIEDDAEQLGSVHSYGFLLRVFPLRLNHEQGLIVFDELAV